MQRNPSPPAKRDSVSAGQLFEVTTTTKPRSVLFATGLLFFYRTDFVFIRLL
ncbi:MAG: hypothetical protein UV82_C0011G0053 [Candidatus Magasanikbacteria bacterium GW2011_GWD2_43_18]|uniref:Uncharacterized protein n=1 Tax=Candidatus Magasanikbacteria bacterium GW2011_GWE2_42_7 TaxID=1619052 RepID=A0A0G1BE97_9BACT|nr:MAG: hypothetical protein UV18_C0007G0056 [Candidatus Magasanikbacteria bacterium GW2011_GWC2_42_27]KKS71524.1 MAG: hypothetical protein UV42_C0025G0003 [Candidatus Magasanikbacteria bacterium GW2011_GWE2_42_7]KKT04125.1 MAG: hypothetical protein UV82_C0011G0053 [Candidatus Magasanikbacteria bacterium GW2011_GWD2_43_18]KKT25696.1 MAG: hypothetical protein UW10_C0005G0063 [Candidatus Magasanikbacteria bacterium GW2011_GWA2_43_9]